MNNLLPAVLTALLITALTSCGNGNTDNIQAQIDELRSQRSQIDSKIKELESKLLSTQDNSAAVPVTVITVSESELPHTVEVKGTIDSKSTVMLSSQLPGRITGVYVTSGQAVRAGQVLAEVDNETIKRGMDEVKVQLDFARTLFERQKRVFEQKAGSEIQYLTAKSQLEALERRMESLREQLAMSRITAPRSGICDNVTAKVGELAAPGMPLMTLVNMSDVRVVVDVSEAFVATISQGDKALITFSDSNDSITTTITSVSKVVNPLNRTFRLEIPLSKVPSTVRPNATCRVAINDITIEKGLSVPLSGVQRDAGGAYVLSVKDNKIVQRRNIQTGITSGAMIQVVSGLSVGDKIIDKGVTTVADGQTVKVVNQ
jgi:membrane fusion protein (multidrug efflux system)